ncbi:hypothetical protein M1N24_01340, partial [Dehalococcoidia bacterium]|nr:hypothetical protein [Dehalococcoidia bacterium]
MTGMASSKAVGKSLKRVEDSRLLRGDGEFIADIKFSRAVHVAFLRSPHPHARIVKVDADRARTLPGVLAIKTGDDLKSLS